MLVPNKLHSTKKNKNQPNKLTQIYVRKFQRLGVHETTLNVSCVCVWSGPVAINTYIAQREAA